MLRFTIFRLLPELRRHPGLLAVVAIWLVFIRVHYDHSVLVPSAESSSHHDHNRILRLFNAESICPRRWYPVAEQIRSLNAGAYSCDDPNFNSIRAIRDYWSGHDP